MAKTSTYAQGGDAQAIKQIADNYYGGYRNMFDAHGWDVPGDKMMTSAPTLILEEYGSIKRFEKLHTSDELMTPMEAIYSDPPNVWLTATWGFKPEKYGSYGFKRKGDRKNFLNDFEPGALILIYVPKGRGPEEDRGYIVGIQQTSGRLGGQSRFIDPAEWQNRIASKNDKRWPFPIENIRSWRIAADNRIKVDDFANETYSPEIGRDISQRPYRLSKSEAMKLLELSVTETSVYGQPKSATIELQPTKFKYLIGQKNSVLPGINNPTWQKKSSAYITSFWGWRPETWGCVGFGTEGRRKTYLRQTTDPFIMVVFITETAPTDQPEFRGKIVGFYEISHEQGSREEFTDKKHHSLEIGKWPYSLRAVRAFSFLPEFQMDIRSLIKDYGQSNATSIGAHGLKLSAEQIEQLREIPFQQVPVFRGETSISEDIIIAEPRKGRTRSGAVNRSGFSVPGEPIDTPKELYILKLDGDTAAFLGRHDEGKSIYKVGLSMSPKRRLATFQKSLPEGAFAWQIERTTRQEIGKPYQNYDIALAGEDAMKDHLADNADWLGGEFYAATEAEIERAWQAGISAAKKLQSKETAND